MNKKDLTELGIAEDIAEKIIVMHGKDIEKHKTALETAQAEGKSVKDQLAEASKQIEAFKGMDIDGIKKAADDWKAKAEKAEADAKTQLDALKFDHSLDTALSAAKAKNSKAVKALLDVANLKLNDTDGSIIGLEDQLKKIKEGNDYLFESDTPTPKIVTGGKQTVSTDSVVDAARKAAGLPLNKE